jgi:hypothetical protein
MKAVFALACLLIPGGLAIQNGEFVELQRTRCFGPCPVYTVRICADGRVLWHGATNVELRGDAESHVPAADARKLIEQFRAKGFWTLPAEYPPLATDFPGEITTVSIGPDTKHVADNAGNPPAWLLELDNEIDSLADTHRWRHGDPRSERFVRFRLFADAFGPKPGVTPLMHAAAAGKIDTVKALLRSEANVNARDTSGWTALMYATDSPYNATSMQIIGLLLHAGADPRIRSFAGQTVLMAVNVQEQSNPIPALVTAGAEVNAQDQWGETALIQAAREFAELDKMQALLDAGARVDLRDRNGRTAIGELRSTVVSSEDEPAKEKAMALLLRYRK